MYSGLSSGVRWQRPQPEPATGGTIYSVSVSGAIAPTGNLVLQINKVLAGATTPVGTFLYTISIALGGAITPTGLLRNLVQLTTTLTGAITPVGTLVSQLITGAAGVVAVIKRIVSVGSHIVDQGRRRIF